MKKLILFTFVLILLTSSVLALNNPYPYEDQPQGLNMSVYVSLNQTSGTLIEAELGLNCQAMATEDTDWIPAWQGYGLNTTGAGEQINMNWTFDVEEAFSILVACSDIPDITGLEVAAP